MLAVVIKAKECIYIVLNKMIVHKYERCIKALNTWRKARHLAEESPLIIDSTQISKQLFEITSGEISLFKKRAGDLDKKHQDSYSREKISACRTFTALYANGITPPDNPFIPIPYSVGRRKLLLILRRAELGKHQKTYPIAHLITLRILSRTFRAIIRK